MVNKGKIMQLLRAVSFLLLGAWGVSVLLRPLEGYLTYFIAWMAFRILSFTHHVTLANSTIYGSRVSIQVVYLCTPAPVFGLVLSYFALTWRGWKDLVLLLVAFLTIAVFDALRIAAMFVLLEHNYSMFISHDITAYVSFLIAIGLIIFVRERI